ncbi:MAG: hypothetical protein H7X80_06850, partial [bacterium]|nr:hypothetical protein [Candidatus Kapabacteria bacterium]
MTLLIAIATLFVVNHAVAVADGISLLKRTVVINTRIFNSYWKDQKAEDPVHYFSAWVPFISFQAHGTIPTGGQLAVDYTLPDGKAWFTEDLEFTRKDGWFEAQSIARNDLPREKRAIPTTGMIGFTIRHWNEIAGTNEVLMTGKFRVDKLKSDVTTKQNEHVYYINEDWRLPIGWVWLDNSNMYAESELTLSLWLRGRWDRDAIHGYLMYNGKQIGSTKNQYASAGTEERIETETRNPEMAWSHWEFSWGTIFGTRAGRESEGRFFLEENPGDYELKVLENGKLIRSMKFTVGPDGKIVDNGIATSNKIGGSRMLVPVTILGDRDGKWNKDGWKTEA